MYNAKLAAQMRREQLLTMRSDKKVKAVNDMDVLNTTYKGTIHILRQHLYSSKLNFSQKLGFFCQNKRPYFSTLHFDKIFMLQLEIFSTYIKKKKNAQKIRENVVVDGKKCLRNV